jgi:hypothetical protein
MGAPKASLIVGLVTLPTLTFLAFLPGAVAVACGVILTVTVYALATGLIRTEPGLDEIGHRLQQMPAAQWARTRFTFSVDVGLAAVVGGLIIVSTATLAPVVWTLVTTAVVVGFVLAYASFGPVRTVTKIALKVVSALWVISMIAIGVWLLASGNMTIGELLDL